MTDRTKATEKEDKPQTPVWTPAQETAIESHDKLILVSAAAGSGKTAVLTERVIRRILDVNSNLKLTDLLIVTFTRAAAAELKSKIAKAIENELSKDDCTEKAREKLREQLLQLGSAQISTIDSFYLQIVRAHFENLGLPANFRLADENELRVLSEEILDGLIPEFYRQYEMEDQDADANDPFRAIRNNPFADCVDHIFSGSSSSDLNGIILKFYDSFSRVKGGIEALRQSADDLRAEAELPFLQTRFGNAFLARFEPFIQSFVGVLEEVKARHQTNPKAEQAQGGVLTDDLLRCKDVLLALQKKDWTLLQSALSAFVFQRFQNAPGKPEWSLRYQSARDVFKEKLKTYTQLVNGITPYEQKKAFLKTAAFADMLYHFYSAFQKRFHAEKIARGIQDFNDVRDALYRLLTDPKNQSLVESIRNTYQEIYIDEYQDVDEIQDEIFAIIGGKKRFMVGDIKQSIYGFRGSDPSVFAGYRSAMPLSTDPGAKSADSVCVFMSNNFRCNQPIIDLTNAVCSFLFSASPQSVGYLPQDDLQYSKTQKDIVLPPAPVSIRVFEKPEKKEEPETDGEEIGKEEMRWVAGEIERLLREGKKDNGSKIEPGDIAVLARSKKALDLFQKELDARNIPVANVSGNTVSHSALFVNLFNLLRVVDNPYRDLPLSEYLLSGFGGFSLEEIQTVRAGAPAEKSLYDALVAVAASESPLAAKAAGFVSWLENYRRLSAAQSADRFLRVLYQDGLFQAYAFSPEFLTVYEQARVYQQSSWAGLYGFLNYLERLTDAEKLESGSFRKAESAVSAMTIHASKGLEYPVVFLLDCGRAMQRDVNKPRLIYRKGVGFASNLYDAEIESAKPSFLKTIADFDAKDAEIEEEIRLLYVAITRAREKLYITATPSRKEDSFRADISLIRKNDRASILSAKSYLDWICAALQHSPEQLKKVDYRAFCGIFAENTEKNEPTEQQNPVVTPSKSANPATARYRAILEKAKTFVYPLEALQGIPTKAAASKLTENLLDLLKGGDEAAALAERIRLMQDEQPDFSGLLDAGKTPSPAQIGSATHAFLALCNFANLAANGVKSELDRLVKEKYLPGETANIVNLRALERFAQSSLMQKISSAKSVYREQQFSLFVPLPELTQNPELAAALAGQELFVQGSIDLILVGQDGKIELYDYKTDHITAEEREDPALLRRNLQNRHGSQLEYYARAVEQLFGKRPDQISIFSLSLGKIVDLF